MIFDQKKWKRFSFRDQKYNPIDPEFYFLVEYRLVAHLTANLFHYPSFI